MRTDALDYDLPAGLIATTPAACRSDARLMVVDAATGAITHTRFSHLPELLHPGDCLVANDTRVLPVRLLGIKASGGAAIEMLLLEDCTPADATVRLWRVIGQRASRLRAGVVVHFSDATGRVRLTGTITHDLEGGQFMVAFESHTAWEQDLAACGRIPLPPYIVRARRAANLPEALPEVDASRYQTVYATHDGSAAAPTAGFHFDAPLLQQLEQRGVAWTTVTLHVGLDTFLPVQTECLEDHPIHTEAWQLPPETAAGITACRAGGGRAIAVGTTSVRTLESAAAEGGLRPGQGRTALFIRPGYQFRVTDAIITNFHLPRSTLLALVAAFLGLDLWRAAYAEAVREEYRFYSYGDAMFIHRSR